MWDAVRLYGEGKPTVVPCNAADVSHDFRTFSGFISELATRYLQQSALTMQSAPMRFGLHKVRERRSLHQERALGETGTGCEDTSFSTTAGLSRRIQTLHVFLIIVTRVRPSGTGS